MINQFLQCCYTNISSQIGEKLTSGWGVVAMSENIPAEAYKKCVDLFSKNSTINKIMVDEDHKTLNLFELNGDGNYLYISRTQYGLLDRVGRPNMFAHSFILPCNDKEMISDPNNYLTFAKENFKDNAEDASAYQESVIRTADFSLDSALEKSNMSDESYKTLISCIYIQMTDNKSKEPLYIKYDGSQEQMFSILYCIYCGLPLSIRRVLSVASNYTDNLVNKNIIFTKNVEDKALFFDPQTGDNNVLTPRSERKISRLGYIVYAVDNFRTIDTREYFVKLEETASDFGYSATSSELTASNELLLKIAYQLLTTKSIETLDDAELDERLSDALRSKSIASSVMNRYISAMLDEITRRSLALSTDTEGNLNYRLDVDKSKELKLAAERYDLHRFSLLEIPQAAEKLSLMSQELFMNYEKKLSTFDRGLQILDYYYASKLNVETCNWKVLNEVFDHTKSFPNCNSVQEKMGDIAWQLYIKAIGRNNLNEIIDNYTNYIKLMSKLISDENLKECENAAKETFWEQLNLSYLDLYDPESYKKMSYPQSEKCNIILRLLDIVENYTMESDNLYLLHDIYGLIEACGDKLSEQDLNIIKNKIIYDIRYSIMSSRNIRTWVSIIVKAPTLSIYKKLYNVYVAIIQNNLEDALNFYENACTKYRKTNSGVPYELTELLINEFRNTDCPQQPVSLDIWLRLGSTIGFNSFNIFDKVKPCILQFEPRDVVGYSSLFGTAKYWNEASEYVTRKSDESKIVKKWISEYSQMVKKNAEAEKGRQPSGENSKGRLSAAFAKNNAGSEEPTRKSNPMPSNQTNKPKTNKAKESSGDNFLDRFSSAFSKPAHDDPRRQQEEKGKKAGGKKSFWKR